MNTFLSKLIAGIGIIGSFIFPSHQVVDTSHNVGAAPQFTAAKPTALYGGGISSSDTSIKLIALVTPANAPITTAQLVGGVGNVFYGTIEPATSRKETVSCTGVTQNGDGTATITGCIRGLQFTYPYTASTSLALSHSGGSSFVLSNSPQLYQDILTYINNAVASSSGAVDASTIVKGVVQVATGQQAASTTPIGGGSTSAPLALTTGIATSSSPGSGNYVVITNNGVIDGSFIRTLASTTITGTSSFSTQGFSTTTGQASTSQPFLLNKKIFQTTTATSTSVQLFTVPTGVKRVWVRLVGGGGGGGQGGAASAVGDGGSGGGYAEAMCDVTASTTITVTVGAGGLGAVVNGSGAQVGSNGGTSSFYTCVSASGGIGGNSGSTITNASGGGIGTVGDIISQGGANTIGLRLTGAIISGGGGNSMFGSGAVGVGAGTAGTNVATSTNGYGGGGSGADTTGSALVGGSGGPGIVIVNW